MPPNKNQFSWQLFAIMDTRKVNSFCSKIEAGNKKSIYTARQHLTQKVENLEMEHNDKNTTDQDCCKCHILEERIAVLERKLESMEKKCIGNSQLFKIEMDWRKGKLFVTYQKVRYLIPDDLMPYLGLDFNNFNYQNIQILNNYTLISFLLCSVI